jgi:hypothetical protein
VFGGRPAARPSTPSTKTAAAKAAKERKSTGDKLVGAAKGVTKTLRAGAGAVIDDTVLVLVGLLTLASALLGGFVIYRSREHLLR